MNTVTGKHTIPLRAILVTAGGEAELRTFFGGAGVDLPEENSLGDVMLEPTQVHIDLNDGQVSGVQCSPIWRDGARGKRFNTLDAGRVQYPYGDVENGTPWIAAASIGQYVIALPDGSFDVARNADDLARKMEIDG